MKKTVSKKPVIKIDSKTKKQNNRATPDLSPTPDGSIQKEALTNLIEFRPQTNITVSRPTSKVWLSLARRPKV